MSRVVTMAEARAGRPRDARAHTAILDAVRELLTTVGYERLTIEGVATRAGVGKQTVYRWWPSKSALVAEAALTGHLPVAEPPEPTGDLEADVRAWVLHAFASLADPAAVALVRGLAAAAADRVEDADRLYAGLTGPARDGLVAGLERGVATGQVRPGADLGVVADTLASAVLFRVLTHRPLATPAEVDGLVSLVVMGVGAGPEI